MIFFIFIELISPQTQPYHHFLRVTYQQHAQVPTITQ